jgi:DNA mismatch repair protein MutL
MFVENRMLMPEIRQLSPSVINKIAAGEVIERPASVVKELIENAVDAGATRIDVSLQQGGLDLVRIADNGCGMRDDQLLLAVASHATSKIATADDLFHVASLGFRGEALASIAEVSEFRICSRTPESTAGAELSVLGGKVGNVIPCGAPVGTVMEVKNLFFNTPVRRKFTRTTQTEASHCTEAFTRIALAFPHIHFTLRHNDKILHDLPPTAHWRERIATFFGDDLASFLIAVQGSDEGIQLSGFVADPQFSRANNRCQYFFLNGRHIRDRALQHALGEAYRGLLLGGRYPIAFLRLEMPAEMVDVNVHPTKLEVRFQDSGRVYSQLLGSLRKKFLTTDLTARVAKNASPEEETNSFDPQQMQHHRDELIRWATGQTSGASSSHSATALLPPPVRIEDRHVQVDLDLRFDANRREPLTLHRIPQAPLPTGTPATPTVVAENHAAENHPAIPSPHGYSRGLQIQNRYIVTESEEGLMVIDQHALHERILYEQIREKVLANRLESQKLLVPEPVTLSPAEAAAVLEAKTTLQQLGIEIEPFGGDTILVSSYPAMLANMNPAEILRTAIERLLAGGNRLESRDLLDELLHMISCKAAIKAGDYLAPEEIGALLEQRTQFADAHHCPHGRPTMLIFSREELDRRFKRT